MGFVQELRAKLMSAAGVVHVRDDDEVRLESKCRAAAAQDGYNVWKWTYSDGLVPISSEITENIRARGEDVTQQLLRWASIADPVGNPSQPGLLSTVKNWSEGPSVVIAYDLFTMVNRLPTLPMAARLLKDITLQQQSPVSDKVGAARQADIDSKTVQLVVCDEQTLELNCPLQRLTMELPTRREMAKILDSVLAAESPAVAEAAQADRERILNAMAGLAAYQAANSLSESLSRCDRVDANLVRDFKKDLVSAKGLTYIEPEPKGFAAVGGLEPIKTWCRKRAVAFDEDKRREYGVRAPKGALAGGKPGCAKSHFAKALSSELGMVLIRLDLGSTRGMYQGQSENQFEDAIKTAEAVAPCILHIDEMEKAFGGSGGGGEVDGGTGSRVLGYFLTWLQEKDSAVFVWGTGNRMDQLPAELMRAGRFDANFWFDLPTTEERAAIADVFLARYPKAGEVKDEDGNVLHAGVDTAAVVQASGGCTGAEIECAFEEAALAAMIEERHMTTEDVVAELRNVSKVDATFTMSDELQRWRDNATKANSEEQTDVPVQTGQPVRRTRRNRGAAQ